MRKLFTGTDRIHSTLCPIIVDYRSHPSARLFGLTLSHESYNCHTKESHSIRLLIITYQA